jgi:integrase
MMLDPVERAARMTLAIYLHDVWLPSYRLGRRASSVRVREGHVTVHIVPMLGGVKLSSLTTAKIEHALTARTAQGLLTPAHAHRVLTTLSCALSEAVRWQYLPRNPAKLVRLPSAPRRVIKPLWSVEQFRAFVSGQEQPWRMLWLLLAGTGMRIGEALALRWSDVDWGPPAVIQIRRTVARGRDGEYEAPPKSDAGSCDVLMPAELVDALLAWQREQRHERTSFDVPPHADGYIVSRIDAKRIPMASAQYRWKRALEQSGLPHMTPHGLRHLATTIQIVAGVPLKIVSARIGHSSIQLTANLYSHVMPEHQETAAASLGALFSAPRDSQDTKDRGDGEELASARGIGEDNGNP